MVSRYPSLYHSNDLINASTISFFDKVMSTLVLVLYVLVLFSISHLYGAYATLSSLQ